jgi:hypothetical protein
MGISKSDMYLVQLFLPLYDNSRHRFPSEPYSRVRQELVEKFGGITTFVRAPARGLWKDDAETTVQDDIVIYEVMAEDLDRGWWKTYCKELCSRFQQESLVVRASLIEML